MADPISMSAYNNSGFAPASGVSGLKTEAGKIKTDTKSLRAQAEAQYKPTYQLEQQGLSNQLTALIKAQTDDSDLLNAQYQQSVNTMMSKLAERGLHTGSLPQTTTAALDKFRNDVMEQRQVVYGTQRNAVRAIGDTLKSNYDLNVQARMYDNKNHALSSLNDLLTQISKIQSSSFQDYINYLLGKKKAGGGGRSSRSRRSSRRSSRSSVSAKTSTDNATPGLGADYFAGTTTKPATVTYCGGKYYAMTR